MTRTRPASGSGVGTVASDHKPDSYTVRKKSSSRPRERWSALTLSSVAIQVQVITKPNWSVRANNSRNKSLSRCARDRPLAPDFWKAELSQKIVTKAQDELENHRGHVR